MKWAELDSRTCSLARTLELVGQPWTLLVLRDLFNGIRRFDDLADHLGIARNVLASRLARLTENGLAQRVPYRQPGHRARHEYRLTSAGLDLCTVMVAFAGWGDRHLAGPAGPPARFEHRDCGAPIRAALLCDSGHLLTPSDRVLSRPGPGARPRNRPYRDLRRTARPGSGGRMSEQRGSWEVPHETPGGADLEDWPR